MLWRQMKSSPRLNKNNKGVTLIEVIAVIAVLSVVMAAVTGFMITGAKMSANVSGTAAESMQEQTAVEFINRRIWDAESLVVGDETDASASEKHKVLNLGNAVITTNNEMVVYRLENENESKEVVICPGNIYFEEILDNTVIYYLNGERHVVHLRVEKSQT